MIKPIALVTGYRDGYPVVQPTDGAAVLPVGMALYVHHAPDAKPVGKFAKFTDGIWREVTAGSAGVPLYEHPPTADVAELVVQEREACAKVCESFGIEWHCQGTTSEIATAIRARSEK